MRVDDSPAPAHLDAALELAEILRPTWPALSEENRLTAAFLNEGEEEADTGDGQPSPEDSTPDDGNQEAEEELASFLDAYDLGDVPEEARPVAEATIKRLNAAYTRQRQQDTQALRDSQQAQMIVDGLMDPQRAPAIAQALGLEIGEAGQDQGLDEFEFEDPNDRIDALEQQLAQQNEITAAERRTQAENRYVTEQIEGLEDKLGIATNNGEPGFSDEEIELIALLADQHRDQEGAPDVEAAFRIFDAAGSSYKKRVPKPRPRPPRRVGGGSAGERQVDLSDEEEREKVMLAAWRAAKASSE